MKKLLLATVAAVGLAALPGVAHATLTFTIWNDNSNPTLSLSQEAQFPTPTVSLLGSYTSNNDNLNFRDNSPFPTQPTFQSAGYTDALTPVPGTGPGGGAPVALDNIPMSSANSGTGVSTFIRITESYTLTAPLTSTFLHDDGMQIFRDATNNNTGTGAIFVCGSPGLTGEISVSCTFPAGSHTLTLLYVEANADPAVLVGSLPPEAVPEPATLALLGSALVGFGVWRRRRRTS